MTMAKAPTNKMLTKRSRNIMDAFHATSPEHAIFCALELLIKFCSRMWQYLVFVDYRNTYLVQQ